MGVPELIVVATFVSVFAALAFVQRRLQREPRGFELRPLPAFKAIRHQMGMAIESGRRPLFAIGRGPLHTSAGPVSIAALQVLREMAETSGQGQLTPQVTVGAATVLPVAQDTVRTVVERSGQPQEYQPADVQFIADDSFPFTYAAGTAEIIGRSNIGSSVAVGRFGTELAIIGEAAARGDMQQVMGSDDPSAIAIAIASTENSLWGEEVFVAGAYLRESAMYLAAIRVQDVLRWLIVVALIAAAILHVLGIT